jgi:N-acetylglucosaminyldiphosphoundecaprenol N-acetyl-beta-D-mannosaminyltransferase
MEALTLPINILGMGVHVISYSNACEHIIDWATNQHAGHGKYVCVANVHMCMTGFDDDNFRQIVNNADFIVPDGRPLVWALRLRGYTQAEQVRGSELFLKVCERAEAERVPVGFYGGSEESLADFLKFVNMRFPSLEIVFFSAPPFRALTENEKNDYVEAICTSGVRILFIGIGCPKQERLMADFKDQVPCVMIGIGAAFDFFSGRKQHAPQFMQKLGLEWLFRLANDPKRLWKRYLKHNPRFIWFLLREAFVRKYR